MDLRPIENGRRRSATNDLRIRRDSATRSDSDVVQSPGVVWSLTMLALQEHQPSHGAHTWLSASAVDHNLSGCPHIRMIFRPIAREHSSCRHRFRDPHKSICAVLFFCQRTVIPPICCNARPQASLIPGRWRCFRVEMFRLHLPDKQMVRSRARENPQNRPRVVPKCSNAIDNA